METMTCRQLGGPGDLVHRGEGRDAAHQQARDAMTGRWRHPRQTLGRYRQRKKAFADLPEA